MSGFFITGTDTGVGKTFVTCALIRALQRRGIRVAPMKPISAGSININGRSMNEDVALLMAATGDRDPPELVNPYCFRAAIAPHIAAKHDGVEIDLAAIQAAYQELAANADCVLVEGAGGFLVPMTESESMALIPAALQLPVVVVVGMRLGCLNHALLTQEAIKARGLRLAGWVANTPAPGETMNARAENLSTLTRMIDAPRIGDISYFNMNDSLQATQAAANLLQSEFLVPTKARQ